jgi:hypothetical protein
MSDYTFKLDQEDADEFSFLIEDGEGCTWRVPLITTRDAVALFVAVEAGIGDYVHEMRAAKASFDADPPERGFEGHGDFTSDDPMERWTAHQASKGRL